MSEPQHPQPQGTDTNAGHPAPTSGQPAAQRASQPGGQTGLESLAAVGARLAQLREAKGWSIDDVSARLKVAPPKLRALEAGDISPLPGTTFALGVVRSYAKMLGADPTPFTQALRREKGVPEPDLSMPASAGIGLPRGRVSVSLGGTPRHRSWLWGVAAVIVALIALAMWHTGGGDSSAWLARLKASANGAAGAPNGASATMVEGQAAASGVLAKDNGASSGAASASETPATAIAGAQATPVPVPAANAPASSAAPGAQQGASAPKAAQPEAASASGVAGESQSTVEIKVTQDSWFSVRQNNGKEVFSGLVRAGDSKQLVGQPPFKVTVGNTAGLESISLDGQPVDPAKYSAAKGNVARFALP
jgi:cytoskeleton protein RodZ